MSISCNLQEYQSHHQISIKQLTTEPVTLSYLQLVRLDVWPSESDIPVITIPPDLLVMFDFSLRIPKSFIL